MKIRFISVLLLASASLISACTSSLSPDTYTNSSAGQVNRVVKGVIVSARTVNVSDDFNSSNGGGLVGTLAGGLAGGVAGSAIGQGRGSALSAIGGAVLGGIAGNKAQQYLTQQQGKEYIIKTSHGSLISVVQGAVPPFYPGQHVLVEYGDRARVIADPSYPNN